MTTLSEGNLRLTLPASVNGRKFDDEQHGLSHCMKAVDWILELPDRTCFIEVKDPDAPGARDHGNRDDFFQELLSGKLSGALATKFRDSFLYEWACNRVDKPISYYVILASADLDDALLMSRTEDLRRKLPSGPQVNWVRAIALDCLVFNIAKWNEVFPEFPLSRPQP